MMLVNRLSDLDDYSYSVLYSILRREYRREWWRVHFLRQNDYRLRALEDLRVFLFSKEGIHD